MRRLIYLILSLYCIGNSFAIEINAGDSLEFNGSVFIYNGKEEPFSCPYEDIKTLKINIEGRKFLIECKKGVVFITQGKNSYLILGGGSHNDMTTKVYATKLEKSEKWILHQKLFAITENYDICLRNYLENKKFCDNYQPECVENYQSFYLENNTFVPVKKISKPREFEIKSFLPKEKIKERCSKSYNFKKNYKLLQKAKKRVPGS